MVNPNNFFDVWDVLQNELFGDIWLFTFGALIVILIITLRNRMPFQISVILSILFLLIVFAAVNINIIYYFLLVIVGTYFGFMVARMFRRG